MSSTETAERKLICTMNDENPTFKKLKFFKKAVNSEEIDLDRIGWTECRPDDGLGYVRGYLLRNYGIKITPEGISEEVDKAILYMLHDALESGNDRGKSEGIKIGEDRLKERIKPHLEFLYQMINEMKVGLDYGRIYSACKELEKAV